MTYSRSPSVNPLLLTKRGWPDVCATHRTETGQMPLPRETNPQIPMSCSRRWRTRCVMAESCSGMSDEVCGAPKRDPAPVRIQVNPRRRPLALGLVHLVKPGIHEQPLHGYFCALPKPRRPSKTNNCNAYSVGRPTSSKYLPVAVQSSAMLTPTKLPRLAISSSWSKSVSRRLSRSSMLSSPIANSRRPRDKSS